LVEPGYHQLFLIDLSALLKQLSNLLGVEVVGVLRSPEGRERTWVICGRGLTEKWWI
jgi:hypothetical protein